MTPGRRLSMLVMNMNWRCRQQAIESTAVAEKEHERHSEARQLAAEALQNHTRSSFTNSSKRSGYTN